MTLYTGKILADWFGLTERRVRQLRDEGILQETRPGLYDLRTSVQRYTAYLRKASAKADLNDERALLTREKREAAAMENRIRRGELHKSEDIEQGLKTVLLNIRNKFLTLPAKLSPKLASTQGNQAEIFNGLNAAVKEILEEISRPETALAALYNSAKAEEESRDGTADD